MSGITTTGTAYVYDRVGNNFNLVSTLVGSRSVRNGSFGTTVVMSPNGKRMLVSATSETVGSGAVYPEGIVYIFERQGNTTSQVGMVTAYSPNYPTNGGLFGFTIGSPWDKHLAMSADGKTIAIGYYLTSGGGGGSAGAAVVFDEVNNTYVSTDPSGNITVTGNLSVTGVITATSARWTLGASGSSHYTFVGIGFTESTNDPTLYLQRGEIYEFVNNSGGSHPFQIRINNGGAAYNNGVTNNGSASGTIRFEVPYNAPDTLYYQCTNHSVMGGEIIILSGVRSIPQNSQTSAYILAASDIGKHISITTGGVTINTGIFSAGDAVSIYNNSGSNQTITQGTSVTLRQAGTANTGNRTLAQYGVCTVLCVGSETFVISGAGLS